MKTLPHGYESTVKIHELAGVSAYMACLSHIVTFINEHKNGEYINATLLKSVIWNTAQELMALKTGDDMITEFNKILNP